MAGKLYSEIPSLDLADFINGTAREKSEFFRSLGDAYTHIGFVSIRNHLLDNALQENLYESVREFFALPEQVKLKYEKEELFGQRGYIGKGKEHAKGRNVGDLKEFFHIGQELDQNDQINFDE
ncbi:MAG: 2-oxoglutarate and iron-dependent oxygenase domain-containing protein, partial [Cyclobacteriaceae bacterium]